MAYKKYITSVLLLSSLCLGAKAQQATFAPFYDAPKESYVKSMKTVFEDLHSRKWEKAQKDYAKVEEKSKAAQAKNDHSNTQMQALYPLPQLAMAILLSTENTGLPQIPLNYEKAYYYLKPALTFNDKSHLNAFLKDPDINVNLDMLEDRIENELCKKATATNTEQGYDAVIDSLLPQSLRLQNMKMQREMLVFDAISKDPTETECLRYLKKYTDAMASRKATISHALDSIRYATIDGTEAGYKKYLTLYPNSSYSKRAQDSIEVMEYRKVDNTAASCRTFMKEYPSSKYFMEVKKRLEKYAYNEAVTAASSTAYLQYCEEFPYDLHYQNIFDSLLCKTINNIYDSVFVGKEPDHEMILSSSFLESVKRRDAADQSLIEHSMIPPRRRNLWTGLMTGSGSKIIDLVNAAANKDSIQTQGGTASVEIKDFGIKSKKSASVLALLTIPNGEKPIQTEIYLDFIFEDKLLKLDDIRLDNGKTSQKSGSM